MRLAVHLNEGNVKQVKNFLTCCGKLGTVLLIEASTNKMCWRIINSAKSACLMISLQSRFFEHYLLYDVNLMTASVLLKHLLAAFRTPKIKSLELEIVDHEVLTIVVHSESGLMKRYQVGCVEEEHVSASIDRNQLPTTITADAFQLQKVLNSFQNSLDEVSLVVRPQNPKTQDNQHIQMASYNDSGKARKGRILNTIINIDVKGGQLFKSSVLRSNDTMEATFNIKDFAVIVALCKAMHADIMLHMGTPGTPLLVEASNIGAGNGMDAVDAELLLATFAEYVQNDLPEAPPEAVTPAPNAGLGCSPISAGGIATPSIPHPEVNHLHARPAPISPPQYHQHHQPSQYQAHEPRHDHMYPQHTQQHDVPSQQHPQGAHAAPHITQTPAHVQAHMQHPQHAPSGVVLDTNAPQELQRQNGWAAVPETAMGTAAPVFHGMQADACLGTPPNFNMAARHAGGNAIANATPAHLDPPALPHHHPQNGAHTAAATEPSQAAYSQQDPPSFDAFDPSLRVPSQHFMGGADTQGMGHMHDENAEEAKAVPLTLRLPGLATHGTHIVGVQGGSGAQAPNGMSSWSDLRGDTPGAGLASASDAGHDFGIWPKQSQQVDAGAGGGVTQDQIVGVDTGHVSGDDAGGGSGVEKQGWGGAGADVGVENSSGVDNRAPQHNNIAATTHTQNGSASRSLVRLAEIIKQDERARQAGGSAPVWGSAANHVETISMRVAGEQLDDDEQMLEEDDGEFAADDFECLATPPEDRPDTVFG